MPTMQQLTYVDSHILQWQEVVTPQLTSGLDAIVRPVAVARCDLDLIIATGNYRTRGPFALGHEMTAVVESVGDNVADFVPGDRVIVPFQISCGVCTHCRRGWTNACSEVPKLAAYGLGTHPEGDHGGALSDFVRVPFADHMLVTLPDTLSFEVGCGLSDNVADGYRTVAEGLQRFPGEPVLVVGGLAQSIGLYAVHAAIALGSRRVLYCDFDAGRLALAKAAGAQTLSVDYSKPLTVEEDFLITVDASALPGGLRFALESTAPCGYCTGVAAVTSELPLNPLYLRGITYNLSRVHSRAVLPEVLQHVCAGHLKPLEIVDRICAFDDADQGIFEPAPKVIFTRDTALLA